MDNEVLEILERLESKIDDNTNDIKEIKTKLDGVVEQFTDFEGKSANNHVELINRLDNMQKDLNTMELVTSKNWNDIAQLKAVK